MNSKKGLKLVIIFSILAVIIFSYLVNLHYKGDEESFCDISTGVSCDIVNKSVYSELFGVPIALFGALTFLLIGILSFIAIKSAPAKSPKKQLIKKDTKEVLILKLLLAILSFSVLFSLWLIYAELYLILSICVLCVVSDIIILITLFILIKLNENSVNKKLINAIKVLAIITALIVIYLLSKILKEVF